MTPEAEKYLRTEREISSFRAESLRKMLSNNEPSTRRLLEIEDDFLKIQFEKISSTLPELLSAIKIFRDSRGAFYSMYPEIKRMEVPENISYNPLEDCLPLISEQVSILSDGYSESILDFRSKGRTLTILLSLYSYIKLTNQEVKNRNLNIDYKELLYEVSAKYSQDIFSLYNGVIEDPDTTGLNLTKEAKNMVLAVKPLQNILEELISEADFLEIKEKNVKGKNILGFFIPIKHIGREIMQPYHLHLFDEDGFNVSKLFKMQPKNILHLNDKYYKFIHILCLDEIKNNLILLDKYHLLMNKLSSKDKIKIDPKKSLIMIPSSRTEDEGIRDSFESVACIFSNILKKISN